MSCLWFVYFHDSNGNCRWSRAGKKVQWDADVPSSWWESKGMITPELTLYSDFGRAPKLFISTSPAQSLSSRIWTVLSFRKRGRSVTVGVNPCLVWACVDLPREAPCAGSQLITEAKRPGRRQCFWSRRSAQCVVHLCPQINTWIAPVTAESLVPACLSAGAGRDRGFVMWTWGTRQQTGDSPAASCDVNVWIAISQILEEATDQPK